MLAGDYQEAMAAFFKALGNETRILILQLLRKEEEMNVTALYKELEKQQYQISRHLACLGNCGLVSSRKEGRMIYYSLNGRKRIEQILTIADEHVQLAFENILACRIIEE
ncbi:MAG: ArsR/SmtB family transcription factor [Candidatus Heimdallarchaeota archaeon]